MQDEHHAPAGEPSREAVWKMFDRIAPRYDFLNRVLSFRRDVAWRKKMAAQLDDRKRIHLLDLATGTGDQIFHLLDAGADIESAIGMDMSEQMLAVGLEKIRQRGLSERVSLCVGDATSIPAESNCCDVTTISFGIRNVVDVSRALEEMMRVLRPGGCALILEFSMPTHALMRLGYSFYLRHLLPLIGGALSGDAYAYRYLNKTIETFPYGNAFCDLMRNAGFQNASFIPLTFGVASIYRGEKVAI
ncbi:MAG: bifunctional demethylmenaquinone methyltransferase/2-methoxy-6-polyprenyl-1,4-benzoquinol methylase UbiE [Verrucomicrobia bacterium]|nr:bifunctional demethylmenaquinone methyltransferase/2-methoxy-6-polyprenyl-1,4-benzoquinol methylase UbiE [Verrucomicrobiota bacterium]